VCFRKAVCVFLVTVGLGACTDSAARDDRATQDESGAEGVAVGGASSATHEEGATSDSQAERSTPSSGAAGSFASSTPTSADSSAATGSNATPQPGQEIDSTQPNTERFTDVGTRPFVLAAHDPYSTFAADVDTASYDIFRRNVEHGWDTEPTAVRVEDFVNYFRYDYQAPSQDAEHPFSIDVAATKNPLGRDDILLRVGIAAEDPPPVQKRPANLVFLVDVSGSMLNEDKLPLVQYLLKHALDVLSPSDRVSIVTYAGSTAVRLEPTLVSDKPQIVDVIDSLSASGSTNGAGGIQLAYQQAESAFITDGINHIVLCTDGDFNVGVSSDEALVELITQKRKTGITLTALGFGIGNLNDSMMEKVSNAGNGIYSVISSQTQAQRYAEDRLLRTLVHVAKDMKIQLEWNPKYIHAYRLIGYEDRAIADRDFRNDAVDAGEIGAGLRVTALYEVVLEGQEVPDAAGAPAIKDGEPVAGEREVAATDWVSVKVRYKQPGAKESASAREVAKGVAASQSTEALDAAGDDLRWTVAIAAFAEMLKHSPYAAPSKLSLLREVFVSQQDRDVERKEFLELFDRARGQVPATTPLED